MNRCNDLVLLVAPVQKAVRHATPTPKCPECKAVFEWGGPESGGVYGKGKCNRCGCAKHPEFDSPAELRRYEREQGLAKAVRHEPAGQSEVNPTTGKTVHGGQFAPDDAMGQTIQLSANTARLWATEMSGTYRSTKYGMLAVREMLQNAVDAVKGAQRKGQISAGQGEVRIDLNPGNRSIRCYDNGTGMSMDDLLNKFLSLGSTSKDGEGQSSGGFGVAKAVIIGCSSTNNWTIKTRDNIIHSHQMGQPVSAANKFHGIDGTEFEVRDVSPEARDSSWASYTPLQMAQPVIWSDTKGINTTVSFDGKTIEAGSAMRGKRTTELEGFSGEWMPGTQVRVRTMKGDSSTDDVVVRLNGLFQYSSRLYSEHPIGKYVILDVTTTARPGTASYPFNKGRDALSGQMQDRLQRITQYLQRETHSAERDKQFDDTIYVGHDDPDAVAEVAFSSVMAPVVNPIGDAPGRMAEVPGLMSAIEGFLNQAAEVPIGSGKTINVERREESADRVASIVRPIMARLGTLLEGVSYKTPKAAWLVRKDKTSFGNRRKFDVTENVPLLTAWDTICHVLGAGYASKTGMPVCGELFGTGFILDTGHGGGKTLAQATQGPNTSPYVLINPLDEDLTASIKAAAKGNPDELANQLRDMACHELAHLSDLGGGHNEQFTSRREGLARQTSYLYPTIRGIVDACFNTKPVAAATGATTLGAVNGRVAAAISAPKVTFKDLMMDGTVPEFTRMFLKGTGYWAKVQRNGSLVADDNFEGSIHAVAAHLRGWPAANGWDMWEVAKPYGGTVSLADLRNDLIARKARQ